MAEGTIYVHSVVLEQMQTENSNVTKPLPKSKEQNLYFYMWTTLPGCWPEKHTANSCVRKLCGNDPGRTPRFLRKADTQDHGINVFASTSGKKTQETQNKMEPRREVIRLYPLLTGGFNDAHSTPHPSSDEALLSEPLSQGRILKLC